MLDKLEAIKADFASKSGSRKVSVADLIVLGGSAAIEKAAKDAGVDVTLDIYPEMQHVFHFMAGNAPEADDAIAKLAAWIKPKLGM